MRYRRSPKRSVPETSGAPEIWGGIECTHNRVGDCYQDQLDRTGHSERIHDLDQIAALGFRTLRYPILWERTAPDGLASADWRWATERLERLQQLGIKPIVGLVHHGSGPRDTDLLDPQWGTRLGAYAGEVARRFPWVNAYTPVNEPLTTARFSGLYGHWHPHHRSNLSFARALLNQVRGIALAMRAIREVNSKAELVQTEDLGQVRSTPGLAYQADFENERRWLTFDLLSGRVDRRHPMHDFLTWCGIGEEELSWFVEHPTPPQVTGINYYVLSDRFLAHPDSPECDGTEGNERERYRDVDASRHCGIIGIAPLLEQAWKRYQRPLVVSEAHIAGPGDDQYRWLVSMWDGVCAARRSGADVRALTVWSLLGAWDWNSLCTTHGTYYEAGVFDARGRELQLTDLAHALPALMRGERPVHSALDQHGWWQA